ncbi:MAG: hypothetical protein ACTSW1_15605 [Candidatus Hodarchaeales archaeon]
MSEIVYTFSGNERSEYAKIMAIKIRRERVTTKHLLLDIKRLQDDIEYYEDVDIEKEQLKQLRKLLQDVVKREVKG